MTSEGGHGSSIAREGHGRAADKEGKAIEGLVIQICFDFIDI